MKLLSTTVAFAALCFFDHVAVDARMHKRSVVYSRHRRSQLKVAKRACKLRAPAKELLNPTLSTSSAADASALPSPDAQQVNVAYQAQPSSSSAPVTWSEPEAAPQPANNGNNGGGSGGGDNGATDDTTQSSGPNGAEWWLMAGVDGAGWNPPYISLATIKTKDLHAVLGQSSPFSACSAHIEMFYQVAAQYGLPPIMLASTAMQESGCNAHATGGNGEAGLMQLASQNCAGAPNGNCYDPWFNVQTGAKYLKDRIDGAGGNVLIGLAQYNGFHPGGTIGSATAMQSTNCLAQNNLDYIHQTVNGWYQGIDGHSLGIYRNLDMCR